MRGIVDQQKTIIAAAISMSQTHEPCEYQGHMNCTLCTANYQLSRKQSTQPKSQTNSSGAWTTSHFHYDGAYTTQQSLLCKTSMAHIHQNHPYMTPRPYHGRRQRVTNGRRQRVTSTLTHQRRQIQLPPISHERHHDYIKDSRATTSHHPRLQRHPQASSVQTCPPLHPLKYSGTPRPNLTCSLLLSPVAHHE